jgi:hypothetical protein
MKEEEVTSIGVVKLATVVTLDTPNGSVKLSANIAKKVRKNRESVGL